MLRLSHNNRTSSVKAFTLMLSTIATSRKGHLSTATPLFEYTSISWAFKLQFKKELTAEQAIVSIPSARPSCAQQTLVWYPSYGSAILHTSSPISIENINARISKIFIIMLRECRNHDWRIWMYYLIREHWFWKIFLDDHSKKVVGDEIRIENTRWFDAFAKIPKFLS